MVQSVEQQVGNYRLLQLLGQGSSSDVYLGEELSTGVQAAIKIFHERSSSENYQYFKEEAQIVAHLTHPNIIPLREFGIEDDRVYMAMDYIPNGTLRQQYPQGSTLPIDTMVNYIKQIASALQYAHDQQIVHRDVKPENILCCYEQHIFLSDFGLAVTPKSESQRTRGVEGTLAYMAPEQLQGQAVPASDQYALGIMVYEWLCGERPFHGTPTEIVARQVVATPPSLREKFPFIPQKLEDIVMRALAKEPQQRFHSVQEFADEFVRIARTSVLPQRISSAQQREAQVGEAATIAYISQLLKTSKMANIITMLAMENHSSDQETLSEIPCLTCS